MVGDVVEVGMVEDALERNFYNFSTFLTFTTNLQYLPLKPL